MLTWGDVDTCQCIEYECDIDICQCMKYEYEYSFEKNWYEYYNDVTTYLVINSISCHFPLDNFRVPATGTQQVNHHKDKKCSRYICIWMNIFRGRHTGSHT